jgi:hypothetical protein
MGSLQRLSLPCNLPILILCWTATWRAVIEPLDLLMIQSNTNSKVIQWTIYRTACCAADIRIRNLLHLALSFFRRDWKRQSKTILSLSINRSRPLLFSSLTGHLPPRCHEPIRYGTLVSLFLLPSPSSHLIRNLRIYGASQNY